MGILNLAEKVWYVSSRFWLRAPHFLRSQRLRSAQWRSDSSSGRRAKSSASKIGKMSCERALPRVCRTIGKKPRSTGTSRPAHRGRWFWKITDTLCITSSETSRLSVKQWRFCVARRHATTKSRTFSIFCFSLCNNFYTIIVISAFNFQIF